MSLYFDLVLNCYLREDTPEETINAIRCLTSSKYELETPPKLLIKDFDIWDMFYEYHFLAPMPEFETISSFRQSERYVLLAPFHTRRLWCLQFSGRQILDDLYNTHHWPFVNWLASVAYEEENQGFIGYMKETYEAPFLMYVRDGELITENCTPVDKPPLAV